VKYRKRPVVIEAMQWDGRADSAHPIIQWINATEATARWRPEQEEIIARNGETAQMYRPARISIRTIEGTMDATPGDWIIKGVAGEFYPCKPDIFEATYEAVSV
jgi:hypothetical protein